MHTLDGVRDWNGTTKKMTKIEKNILLQNQPFVFRKDNHMHLTPLVVYSVVLIVDLDELATKIVFSNLVIF